MKLYLLFVTGFFVVSLACCQLAPADNGEKLARQYCGSCHLFPEPRLLDKTTWAKSVLPNMAIRLGLGSPGFLPYKDMTPDELSVVIQSGAFADKPLISNADWEKIESYYREQAPEKPLPQAGRLPVEDTLQRFRVQLSRIQYGKLPAVTFTGFDPQSGDLYIADRRSLLYHVRNGRLLDSLKTESPVVDLDFDSSRTRLMEIGVMDPNDQRKGSLWEQRRDTLFPVLQHLNRPVNISRADLNQDGREDLVVCQHGNYAGRLSWYENSGNGQYLEHVLRPLPGARRSIITDWNHDGKPDILSLFGQGREGVWLYINHGNGQFEEKALLEFPPVYGSSYIELADIDGDGFEDLLYTNGDNADFSICLKNFHGLRIYRNDGHGGLKEPWFFPVNGASKVLASDFDRDGDIDMALISFFPDTSKHDSFLYFENKGKMEFGVSSFPEASQGRWLVACAGDIDGDGDDDIVLGSFLLKAMNEFKLDPKNPPPVLIVLENRTVVR